ncbi:hypothetical protein VPH35_040562 [Triticum aestivum]
MAAVPSTTTKNLGDGGEYPSLVSLRPQSQPEFGKEMERGSSKEKERVSVGELQRIERAYEREMNLMQEDSGKEMEWVRKFRKLDRDYGEAIVEAAEMKWVRRFWRMERKYKEEMEIQSRKDMGRTTYLVRNKRDDTFTKPENLADALCRHIVIQRREITALERQVESRGLATIAGKKAYLDRHRKKGGVYAPQQLPPEMIEKMSELSVSSEINLLGIVSLPYLVRNHGEALNFLVHECQEFGYRIQSLASILRTSSIPIRLDKVKKLRLISQAFVTISKNIMDSCRQLNVDDLCRGIVTADILDPFLLLTGPSRAIVAADMVKFEIELRIMYAGADTKDTVLFSSTYNYYSMQQYANPRIHSCCGMLELSVERLTRAVQATIVGVRVVEGEWPFQYRCRVSCYLSPDDDLVPTTPTEVVLVNCKVEEMEKQSDGYVNLSRNVVSVQLEQTLEVVIQAYSESGPEYLHNVEADFPVQQCQTTKRLCTVGNSTVEIVVAWSLLAIDKLDLVLEGYVTPV